MVLEKQNSTASRHPVWIALLAALMLGQVGTLVGIFFGVQLKGFSGVIPGWQVFLYNIIGLLSGVGIIFGLIRQRPSAPIGKFITALLIERYSTGVMALVVFVYTIHSILKPGGNIPYILFFLGVGLIGQWWRIGKELKEIKQDLAYIALVQRRADAEEVNGRI